MNTSPRSLYYRLEKFLGQALGLGYVVACLVYAFGVLECSGADAVAPAVVVAKSGNDLCVSTLDRVVEVVSQDAVSWVPCEMGELIPLGEAHGRLAHRLQQRSVLGNVSVFPVLPALASAEPPGHERAGADGQQHRDNSLRQPGWNLHDFLLQCVVAIVTSAITTVAMNKLLDWIDGKHTTRQGAGQ